MDLGLLDNQDEVNDSFRAHLQLHIPQAYFGRSDVQVSVDQAEACDCTLRIASYDQETQLEIVEHGWGTDSRLYISAYLLDQQGQRSHITTNITSDYQNLNITTRENTSRGVMII
ncbi:MAG: hypothetical protein H6765_11340 [Candidatus Peribacteria bacterium]|nr:MAG: hypothetical protein H6765_11340 [Candidatus Peribacteria bacterium]